MKGKMASPHNPKNPRPDPCVWVFAFWGFCLGIGPKSYNRRASGNQTNQA